MPIYMNEERKRELCEEDVRLNGEPARISGVRNEFATVCQYPHGLCVEFAWQTVERIVNNGGNFRA